MRQLWIYTASHKEIQNVVSAIRECRPSEPSFSESGPFDGATLQDRGLWFSSIEIEDEDLESVIRSIVPSLCAIGRSADVPVWCQLIGVQETDMTALPPESMIDYFLNRGTWAPLPIAK